MGLAWTLVDNTGVQFKVLNFIRLTKSLLPCKVIQDFLDGSVVKNLPAKAGDMTLTPGSGRSLGGGNGNPLQYSCLGNATDRGAWWATVLRVAENWTRLGD